MITPRRRLQSGYVLVGDGVRLAVDVWLPVERIAAGEAVGAVVRTTRYHRAGADGGDDSNRAEAELWSAAGIAIVVADARGTLNRVQPENSLIAGSARSPTPGVGFRSRPVIMRSGAGFSWTSEVVDRDGSRPQDSGVGTRR